MASVFVMVALTFFTLAAGATLEKMPKTPTFREFYNYIINHVVLKSFTNDQSSKTMPSEDDIKRLFMRYNPDKNERLSAAESQQVQVELIDKIDQFRIAKIIVDFQNDFVTGSLAVKNAMEAVPPLQRLLARHDEFQRFIYTKDWHPANHISFFDSLTRINKVPDPNIKLSDKYNYEQVKTAQEKSFQTVHFDVLVQNVFNPKSGQRKLIEQMLYPIHCVQGSDGAKIIQELEPPKGAVFVEKGSDRYVEAYSGFKETDLESKHLRPANKIDEHIDALFISGLALDICVAATALDAATKNYFTAVVLDCSKGLNNEQINKKLNELRSLNVAIIDSTEVEQFLNTRKVPWSWLCKIAGIPLKGSEKSTLVNTIRHSPRRIASALHRQSIKMSKL